MPTPRLALLCLLPLALAACSTAEVRLPDDLAASAESHAVEGLSPRRFGQDFRFGPYRTVHLHERSEFAWAFPIGAVDLGRASRPWSYTLVSMGQPPVEVQCRTRQWSAWRDKGRQSVELDLTGLLARDVLGCGLAVDGREPWSLGLRHTGRAWVGRLQPDGNGPGFELRSLHRLAGSAFGSEHPVGYEISRNGRTVAALETINGGRIHLDTAALPERERLVLAAAATALMMYDPEASADG